MSPPPPLKISAIVPTFNEEGRIGGQLQSLTAPGGGLHEVFVTDGGSTDRTAARVRAFPTVRWLDQARGRAWQMNAAARQATGDVLLFVHADVELPPGFATAIREVLADPGVVAGAFRTWTVGAGRKPWPGPLVHLADLRSRCSRLPYGDQALFVREATFRELGGFPEQPLMEDLEFSQRLSRAGRIKIAPTSVRVSARRFEARPLYYFTLMNLFPLLYRLGVPPRTLARFYGHPR